VSTSRQITVWCDVEGCSEWNQQSGNIRQVRKEVRKHGWALRNGKDLCPKHKAEDPTAQTGERDGN
jgi:hypothetical protein